MVRLTDSFDMTVASTTMNAKQQQNKKKSILAEFRTHLRSYACRDYQQV